MCLKPYFSPSPSWCEGCFIHWQRKTIRFRWKSVGVVPNFLHVCLFSSHKFQSNFNPPNKIHLNKSQHIFGCVFGWCVSIVFLLHMFFLGGRKKKRGRVSRWKSQYRVVDHSMPSTSTPTWKAPPSFTLGAFGSQNFIHLFWVCLRRVPQRFVLFFFFLGSSKRGLLA